MKVGDLVKWIGFPGACDKGVRATGPDMPGIIISMTRRAYRLPPRLDVLWGDGSVGRNLYVDTVEVINENR